jgi:uncharacterized protein (DUF169 family)
MMPDDAISVGRKLSEYLGMEGRPVGVKVLRAGEVPDEAGFDKLEKRATFCRYVSEAAKGRNFIMRLEDLKCNNAELTLGLREPHYGDIEFRLPGHVEALRIGPLDGADIVLMVLQPGQVMTAALIIEDINLRFRKNRAVCGDGVTEVFNTGVPRLTFLCVGSRTSGGFTSDQLVLSIPYTRFMELPAKMSKLGQISRKAQDSLVDKLAKIH